MELQTFFNAEIKHLNNEHDMGFAHYVSLCIFTERMCPSLLRKHCQCVYKHLSYLFSVRAL